MPDKIVRDIKLIQRYSRHNENEDWRFRTQMRVRFGFNDPELNGFVKEKTDEVWGQIDCLSCGNCCKTLAVVVDDKDVKRLAKRLNMTPAAFGKQYVKRDEGGRVFNRQPCPFLGAGNACSVYEDRPQACRDFPYLHNDMRSHSIMAIENCSVCPIVFNVWQALKEKFGRRRQR